MTSYIHHIPGRLRVRVARVKGSRQLALRVEKYLLSLRGIRTAAANPLTGNVLIHYDPALTDVTQFAAGLAPYQQKSSVPDSAGISPEKGSGQVLAFARLITTLIARSVIETAMERALLGILAAVL